MFFNGRNSEKVGRKIVAKLSRELNTDNPLAFQAHEPDDDNGTLFLVTIQLPGPIPATVSVEILPNGLFGAMVGRLFYSAILPKRIDAPVWLEKKSMLSRSEFCGDAQCVARLEGHNEIAAKARCFMLGFNVQGKFQITAAGRFEVRPEEDRSILRVDTLMDTGWFSSRFDAKGFLRTAALVNEVL